jgi:hypothetical protein
MRVGCCGAGAVGDVLRAFQPRRDRDRKRAVKLAAVDAKQVDLVLGVSRLYVSVGRKPATAHANDHYVRALVQPPPRTSPRSRATAQLRAALARRNELRHLEDLTVRANLGVGGRTRSGALPVKRWNRACPDAVDATHQLRVDHLDVLEEALCVRA